MSYGLLMKFVREQWGRDQMLRNGSIVKAMWKRWPEQEVEAMVHGAALLGWKDLRTINSEGGVGRRMALAKYWETENHRPARQTLESLGHALKRLGLTQ